MTTDVYTNWKTSDMSRISFNIYGKCSNSSTQTCRTYAQIVDFFQKFNFKFFYIRDLIVRKCISCQSFFRKDSTFFKSSTNANTNNDWRASIWSSLFNSCQNCFFNPFNTLCRLKHIHFTHIFTAKTFWRQSKFNLIARNN